MQFGSEEPVPDGIITIDFDVKSELALLGLKIQNDCGTYSASKDLIEEKIRNQINPILHTWIGDSCFTCDGS